jgi:hypothetical protein
MKRKITTLLLIIGIAQTLYAQTGVNTRTVDPNAALEVSSNTNKGLLLPRVALTGTSNIINLSPFTGTIAAGMIVYNTATAGSVPNDVSPGFYYNDGTKWVRILNSNDVWTLAGNGGTSSAVNFIGTTDAQALSFRTNNIDYARLDNTGRFSIGNPATAKERLHVENGNIFVTNTANTSGVPNLTIIPTASSVASTNSNPQGKISFFEAGSPNLWGMDIGFVSPAIGSNQTFLGNILPGASQNGIYFSTYAGSATPKMSFFFGEDGTAYKASGAGGFVAFSDRRTKKNIRPFVDGLAVIEKINPVWYEYNGKYGTLDDGKPKIGVVAQEIEQVAPYTIVDKLGSEKILTYEGSALTYVLINAVKEQQRELAEIDQIYKLLLQKVERLERKETTITTDR